MPCRHSYRMLFYQKSCWALATVAEQTSTNKAMQRDAHIVIAVEHAVPTMGTNGIGWREGHMDKESQKTHLLPRWLDMPCSGPQDLKIGLLGQTEPRHRSKDSNPGRDQQTVELVTNIHQSPDCPRSLCDKQTATTTLKEKGPTLSTQVSPQHHDPQLAGPTLFQGWHGLLV